MISAVALDAGAQLTRTDTTARMQLAAPAPSHTKASVADSLAAEKQAWTALREMFWSTGTREYKARKAMAARVAIVDALKITPGNEWLNSYRVRYPVPGAPAATAPASRAMCGASPWWCDLMYLLAVHRGGNHAQADSVLAASLAVMPDHIRCIWGDVAPLLVDRKSRREYERMPCRDRKLFEDRLWWLADPLHSRAGNERRVEHFARQANLRLAYEGTLNSPRAVPGFPWSLKVLRRATHIMHGSDLISDSLMREFDSDSTLPRRRRFEGFLDRADDAYGYANPLATGRGDYSFWEILDRTIRLSPVGRTPQGPPPASHSFIPSVAAIMDPLRAEPAHWQLESNKWYESGFSPIGGIVPIDHQHGYFRRGDSARLVVVSDARNTQWLAGTLSNAALALSRGPYDAPVIFRLPTGPRFAFSPLVAIDSTLVSVEIVAISRGGGRTRFGAAPPARSGNRLDISDLLLLETAAVAGTANLDAILPRVLAVTRLREGANVALYWEMYGLNSGERPSISIVTTPESSGGLVGAINPFANRPSETRSTYVDEAAAGNPIEGRVLGVNLSALRAGRYLLSVRVELPGQAPVVASRRIEITR